MRKKTIIFSILLSFSITTGTYAYKKLNYGDPCGSQYARYTTTLNNIPNGCGEYDAIQWTCNCVDYITGASYSSTGFACVIP